MSIENPGKIYQPGKATITKLLNLRSAPNTKSNIVGTHNAGSAISYEGYTLEGENIDGMSRWYFTQDGHWFWEGGIKTIESSLNLQSKILFTPSVNSQNKWWWDYLNIENLWSKSQGENITIAVLDSGIDLSKDFLVNKVDKSLSRNYLNFTDEIQDEYGHGTHCASLIASPPYNDFCGIAPKANLVIAKVTNNDQVNLTVVRWALEKLITENKIDIFSLSLGDENDEPKLFGIIEEAVNKYNKIFVCAVGNNYNFTPIYKLFYPSAYGEKIPIITTGSIERDNSLSDFNYLFNKTTTFIPGRNILSLSSSSNPSFNVQQSGTSQANAIMAGIVALITSYYKSNTKINPGFIKDKIAKNIIIENYPQQNFEYPRLLTNNLLN